MWWGWPRWNCLLLGGELAVGQHRPASRSHFAAARELKIESLIEGRILPLISGHKIRLACLMGKDSGLTLLNLF